MYELIKDEVYVSKNVADYAIGSGQLFLIASLVGLYLKHYYLSGLLFCVYISTMIFWTQVSISNNATIKWGDCMLSLFVFIFYITYAAEHYFKPTLKPLIYSVFIISMVVFLVNEIVYYYTIKTGHEYGKIANIKDRESMNYTSIFSHIFFLHMLPMGTYFYCIAASM